MELNTDKKQNEKASVETTIEDIKKSIIGQSNLVVNILNPLCNIDKLPSKVNPEESISIKIFFDGSVGNQLKKSDDELSIFERQKDNMVKIIIDEKFKEKYLYLSDKSNKGQGLSDVEESELHYMDTYLTSISQIAAMDAACEMLENQLNRKEYRTMSRAGDVAEVPEKMPIITNQMYRNAITYNEDDTAYIQPLKSVDKLVFKNNILYFEGFPASAAQIKHLYTKDNIETFDLPLLRVFYGTILNCYMKTIAEDNTIEEVITVYYPQLARQMGKSSNLSRLDTETTINDILKFRSIMGITEKGQNILPVLVYMGEDREKNTISFASPYMVKIVKDIYQASIRRNKKTGAAILKKDGSPLLKAAYSYLPNMSLAKEKNKSAVEIVCIVVATIEAAGNVNTPHISARTIIERNQLLKRRILNTANPSNKNKLLDRAFNKAWELLLTKTNIKDKYPDKRLPDMKAVDYKVKWIPTMGTLDMVFEFPSEPCK